MNFYRKYCYIIIEKKVFKLAMMIVIFINTIVLSSYYFMIPKRTEEILNSINLFFTLILTFEALLKIIALKSEYFYVYWNRFDFAILVLTYTLLIIEVITGVKELKAWLRLIRLFQFLRLTESLKLLVHIKKLELLLKTITDTAPILGSFSL